MAFPTALFTKISAKLIPGHGTNAVEGLGLASAVNELQDEMAGVQVVINFQNSGVPKSGTDGTLAGIAVVGSRVFDLIGKVTYVNDGTLASPYWVMLNTPGTMNTIGIREDHRAGVLGLMPIAGSNMSAYMDSGARIFGDGHADSDSGVIPGAPSGEGGRPHGVYTTTNEDLHTINIGGPTASYQPDQHGGAVIDAEFATITALTDRSHFFGFVGGAIDAMVTPATISTTVTTNVLPDLCGFVMDSNGGDADGVFITDNSSNGNATVSNAATPNAHARDLGAPLVADTFVRYRVEIDEDGGFRCFSNKALVFVAPAATMDVDEELSPILQLMAGAAAIKTMHVRNYEHYWNRTTS